MANLRDRATGATSTEVATRPKSDAGEVELKAQIEKMREQFQLAMPKGVEATQLVRDAITCLRQTPKLAECDPKSVLGSLMTCAQLGLRVGVLGHAWVLPFYDKNSRSFKAQLIIGYQGLVELAHRSDRISSLIARIVYSNDELDIAYGLDDRLVHRPAMEGDRGEPIGYYAIVKLNTGGHAFIYMSKREAEDHRDAFAMAKTKDGRIVGPWRDNFDAMAMKTCIIKLAKWMPKSTDLARAIEADEGVRVDLSPDKPVEEVTHHYKTPDTIELEPQKPAEAPTDPPAKKTAAKKAAAKKDDAAESGGPSVPDLHDRIAKAGESNGMDAMALESLFGQQNDGGDIREAPVEQLETFLAWVNSQSPAGEAPQQ